MAVGAVGKPFTTFSPNTMALGDVDGDGDEDVYLGVSQPFASSTGDHSRLYENLFGDHGNSIEIRLSGNSIYCNRDGVGGRVIVTAPDGSVQTRQLTGMVGGSSHDVKKQVFGIGNHMQAKKIQVMWPWGRVTEVPGIQAGQTIVISDEFPAPEVGSIYLTRDESGAPGGVVAPVSLGETFDLYLVAILESGSSTGDQLGSIEGSVTLPSNVVVVSEEIFNGGVDSAPDSHPDNDPEIYQIKRNYSIQFDQGISVDQGPILLVHLVLGVWEEGLDPYFSIGNIEAPEFSDPDPDISIVPSWREHESDVLYRLADPSIQESLIVPLSDSKNPLLIHSGLYLNYRDKVLAVFDEPIDNVAVDGLPAVDLSHFKVYKQGQSSNTISIIFVGFLADSDNKSLVVFLDSEIPEGEAYRIEISELQDLHGNAAGVVDGSVTSAGGGGGKGIVINEVGSGSGGATSKSGDVVRWVELINDSEKSICLSGWTVEVSNGTPVKFPDLPIMILQPGELGVLAADGFLPDLLAPEIMIHHSVDTYGEDTGLLLVHNPFGEQSDSVDTGTVLKSAHEWEANTSIQRFFDDANKSIYWLADAPEYATGLRGTPGKLNRTAEGNVDAPEIPQVANSAILYAAPNPFNPITLIFFSIKESGRITVVLYDLRGRKVKTLFDQFSEPKVQLELVWDGTDQTGARVASGTYFVTMKAPDSNPKPLKILLIK